MSYSIDIYSQSWDKKNTVSLDKQLFCDENINNYLIYEYVRLQRNNGRIAIAHTKNRWEVSWSGKKIYNQKGTWSARAWEKRSPLRKKWWIVFWPRKNKNFTINMNKKSKKKALLWLLISKLKEKTVLWLNNFDLSEIKTKKAVDVLSNLKLSWKTLVVLSDLKENTTKSLSNVSWVKYILYSYINPYDIVTHKNILFEEWSISKIEKQLSIND